jgi:hypothetical protein
MKYFSIISDRTIAIYLATIWIAVLLAFGGCGSSARMSKSSVKTEQASTDSYLSARQLGYIFYSGYYDSTAAWAQTDTSLTKFIASDIAGMRVLDSTNSYKPDFYGDEKSILDIQINQIYLEAK